MEMRRQIHQVTVKMQDVSISDSTDETEVKKTRKYDFKQLVMNADNAENPAVQLAALQQCRELSSIEEKPPIEDLIAHGVLPVLLHSLYRCDYPELQFETARVLRNIAKNASPQIIFDAGVVPPVTELLKSPDEDVREQALWVLGGIIDGGPELRDKVIEVGLMEPLLGFVNADNSNKILRTVATVILKICRCKYSMPSFETTQEILPALNELIFHDDVEILRDAVRAIATLLDKCLPETGDCKRVVHASIIPKLIYLLSHKDELVQKRAVKAIYNIVVRTDEQAQVVLDCGGLSHFPALLSHRNEKICCNALYTLDHFILNSDEQCQAVIDAGLLPKVLECLNEGTKMQIKKVAVSAISDLCQCRSNEQVTLLVNCGVIQPLCDLLTYRNMSTKAMGCLGLILKKAGEDTPQMARLIEECGGVDNMEALKREKDKDSKTMASHMIEKYFSGEKTPKLMEKDEHGAVSSRCDSFECQFENYLVKNVTYAEDPEYQFEAVQQCRKFLSCPHHKQYNFTNRINAILERRFLPILIKSLSALDNPELQVEVAWTLANISAGTSAQSHKVVNAGAVLPLIELVKSPHEAVCESALWALNNIIGDGPVLRGIVIHLGVADTLISFTNAHVSIPFLRTVVRVFRNLVRVRDPPPPAKAVQDILPAFNKLLTYRDINILVDTLWAIGNLVDGAKNAQQVLECGIVSELVTLLSHEHEAVQGAALRAVGYIVAGAEEQTQVVLDCGALGHFPALLSHQNVKICKKALFILSNVVTGNKQQVQAVIEAGLLPRIVQRLGEGDFETRVEAARAAHILSICVTAEQMVALLNCAVIPYFCNLLSYDDTRMTKIRNKVHVNPESKEYLDNFPALFPRAILCFEGLKVQHSLDQLVQRVQDQFDFLLQIVLAGLTGVLEKTGEVTKLAVSELEECGGVDKLRALCDSRNIIISDSSSYIIKKYFEPEVEISTSMIRPKLCNEGDVKAVIEAGLLPKIIEHLNDWDRYAEAVWVVCNLTIHGASEQVATLISCGVIPPLCKLVRNKWGNVVTVALIILRNILEKADENLEQLASLIEQCGVIDKLQDLETDDSLELRKLASHIIRLLRSEVPQSLKEVTTKLENVSIGNRKKQGENTRLYKTIDFTALFEHAANSEHPTTQYVAVLKYSKFYFKGEIINWNDTGFLPILVHSLSQFDNPRLQQEGAWVLSSIITSVRHQQFAVYRAGAVPPLIELLKSQNDDVCEQAVQALGNIIVDDVKLRDGAIEQGLMEPLLSLIKPDTPVYILRAVTAVVLNMCRHVYTPPPVQTIQDILIALKKLILHSDKDIVRDTVQAIAFLVDGWLPTWRKIQLVIDCGLVPSLTPQLAHGDRVVQATALRAVCNLLQGIFRQKQVLLDCGVLAHFPALLSHQDEKICEDAVQALRYFITSLDELHCQAVIDSGLLNKILELLNSDNVQIQTAAARAVLSLSACGTKKLVGTLFNFGVLSALRDLMGCQRKWIRDLVKMSLKNILEDSSEKENQASQIKTLKSDQIEHQNILPIKEQESESQQMRKLIDELKVELKNVSLEMSINECQVNKERKTTDYKELLMLAADAENPVFQLPAVRKLKHFVCCPHHTPSQIDEYIELGFLPVLIRCLYRDDNPTLQDEAANALINIAAGTTHQTHKVVEAGAVPPLIELLKSPNDNLCDNALWALGNIIGDGPELRDRVIELGSMEPLLSLVKPNTSITIVRSLTMVIRNLCRSKILPPPDKIVQDFLPALNELILHSDVEVLSNTLWSIANLLDDRNVEHIEMVIESGIGPKIISCLSHEDVEVQRAAVKAVGNIATGTEEQRQFVLDCGALSHFSSLLAHQKVDNISRIVARTLAYITAGNERQKQTVIDAGLLLEILELLGKGDLETRRGAATTLINLSVNGNKEQYATLISCGVIQSLCDTLDGEDKDFIDEVLQGLSDMLGRGGEDTELVASKIRQCGGVDKMCNVAGTSFLAARIIRQYFADEQ